MVVPAPHYIYWNMADDSDGKHKQSNCFNDGRFLRANIPQLLEHVLVWLVFFVMAHFFHESIRLFS